ncbi:DUF2071 domain-containing protein [Streptomyces sp. SR27]|uniref:DUF2071 domain-containing protein n=1 Tax=Streptomyces sp. SR27 TaxID=3076630 RepID=UPI003FA3593E
MTPTSTALDTAARAADAISMTVGERVEEPTELEHLLTARWGLHSSYLGRSLYLPNTHPRRPLHRARLLDCDESLRGAGYVSSRYVSTAVPPNTARRSVPLSASVSFPAVASVRP